MPTCWDQWYPEAARIAFLKGADLIVYPTAIGHTEVLDDAYREAWRTVMRGHAVANALYVAAVNRVGHEGETRFWGSSFLADPFGAIVAEGGDREEVVIGEVDASRIDRMRRLNHYLRDRRPETYGPLLQRWAVGTMARGVPRIVQRPVIGTLSTSPGSSRMDTDSGRHHE